MPQLGLGTAQFGMHYGVANRRGQTPEAEVGAILERAADTGFVVLDTAPAYGDAEAIIGRLGVAKRFRVVTKTPQFRGRYRAGDVSDAAAASRARLRVDRLDTILIHHPDDIRGRYSERIIDELLTLKSRGEVERIGLSIYDRGDITRFQRLDAIDVVQLPLNLFDQRLLLDGTVESLASRGVEIHVRSIFLQGLILSSSEAIPPPLLPLRPWLDRLSSEVAARGIDPLSAALGFIRHLTAVAVALIGVEQLAQLEAILSAWARAPAFDASPYVDTPADLVDPRRWPKFQ